MVDINAAFHILDGNRHGHRFRKAYLIFCQKHQRLFARHGGQIGVYTALELRFGLTFHQVIGIGIGEVFIQFDIQRPAFPHLCSIRLYNAGRRFCSGNFPEENQSIFTGFVVSADAAISYGYSGLQATFSILQIKTPLALHQLHILVRGCMLELNINLSGIGSILIQHKIDCTTVFVSFVHHSPRNLYTSNRCMVTVG